MKKLNLLALSAVIILVAACGGNKEKHELCYALEKGGTYTQKMKMDMNMNQGSQSVGVAMTCGFTFNITNAEGDNFTADVSFNDIEMSMSSPMGDIKFSSKDGDGSNNPQMPFSVSSVFKAMTTGHFTMTMSKYGELKSVSGINEMVDGVVASLDIPAEYAAQAGEMMKQNFSDEKMKDQLKNMYIYPSHPVAIGESWTSDISTGEGNVKTTYTLKEVNDATVIIDLTSDVSSSQNGVSLKGTQTGSMTIAKSTGWTKEANLKQDLKGQVSGMDITAKTTITITE